MIRLLVLLLIGQAILTAGLYWPDNSEQVTSISLLDNNSLMPLSRIEIGADDGTVISLDRKQQWLLASGLPAAEQKVQVLLDALLKADGGFAIATSKSAARRFKVSEESFEKKVTLTGARAVTVFLGDAPSFRKLYARVGGSDDIRVIELNSHDAPTNEAGWLDRSLLSQSDLSALSVDSVSYNLADEALLESDQERQALDALAQAIANLQVTASAEAPSDAKAVLALSATGKDKQQLTLLFDESTETHFVTSNRFPQTFSLSDFDAERLIEAAELLR